MTTKAVTSPAFEALLGDLATMAKAIDVNQERIAAGRAAEGHMQHGDSLTKSEDEAKRKKEAEEEEERKKKAGGKEHKEGKEHMAKSFTIQTEDGKTLEVMDASEMLKSFGARLDESTATMQSLFSSVVGVMQSQDKLVKSLTDKLEGAATTITEQGTLIKSLQEEVTKLGSAPGGRKAVLTVAERTTAPATDIMAKAGMPEGVTVDDFFAKASDLQLKGQITGVDIAYAETCLNHGQAIPDSIVRRVLGTTAASARR